MEYKFLPVVISMIFAYLIVHCFMIVFEMTVDTMFVCFCEDFEVNNGVTEPFFMSRGLMDVMQKMKTAAGGEFNYLKQNPGGEAGQPMITPQGWKFGNEL